MSPENTNHNGFNQESIQNHQNNSSLSPSDLAKNSMPKFGKILFIILFTTLSVILLSFGIVYLMKNINEKAQKPSNTSQTKHYKKIDLQPTIDQWVASQVNRKNSSIAIYDLNNQEIIGRHNDFIQNNSTGVENLFLVYLALTKIEQGTWKKTDQLNVNGEAITRENCLTKIVQDNHQGCIDYFTNEIGTDKLKEFLKDQSYDNTNPKIHLTNTSDLLNLAKRIYTHPDFSNDLFQELKNKLIPNQNTTNPLQIGFSKLQLFGLYNIQAGNSQSSTPNYPLFNCLYFLETKKEDSKDQRTIALIFLSTDISSASLTDFAKKIETSILESLER